jgi:hypothetical protein
LQIPLASPLRVITDDSASSVSLSALSCQSQLIPYNPILLQQKYGKTIHAAYFKRSLMWSIPAVLITLAIQYYPSGNVEIYAVAITLAIFLLGGIACNGLNLLWNRVFGTSRLAFFTSVILWATLAIGLFVSFYRMS